MALHLRHLTRGRGIGKTSYKAFLFITSRTHRLGLDPVFLLSRFELWWWYNSAHYIDGRAIVLVLLWRRIQLALRLHRWLVCAILSHGILQEGISGLLIDQKATVVVIKHLIVMNFLSHGVRGRDRLVSRALCKLLHHIICSKLSYTKIALDGLQMTLICLCHDWVLLP